MAVGQLKPDAKSEAAREAVTPYWRVLRTLWTVSDQGWAVYAGGTITKRVVRIEDRWRELQRPEVVPWARGLAAAYGALYVIDALAGEKLPDLCDPKDAVPRLGLQWEGMRPRIRDGRIYPLHGPHGWVYLIEAQIELLARLREGKATAQAAARWNRIGSTLPDVTRPAQIREAVTLVPSPDPLPLPASSGAPGEREAKALAICDREGWLRYAGMKRLLTPTGWSVRYTVVVAGRTIGLDQSEVFAFALGVADARDASALVAYRPYLG